MLKYIWPYGMYELRDVMVGIKKRFFAAAVAVAVIVNIIAGTCLMGERKVYAAGDDTVDIVFTTDLHSYLSSYDTTQDGKNVNIGGMPRAATYINAMRDEHPELVLLDAGDYPMGTLYQTLYSEEAFEYRMLSFLEYDGITFGNHDFDYGTEGMARQFEAAKAKCDYYPNFLICNVDWNAGDAATERILNAMDGMNLKEYTIIERGGLKIGITGVLGKDALKCAPTCELTVLDPVESVKKTVEKMKQEEDPDCIVVISHSGTTEEGSKEESEDEILAEEVPDIDFIVSGHMHRVIPECLKVGDTYIGSSGCYGENVGYVRLKQNQSGRFDLVSYEITPMDEKIPEDPEVVSMLEDFDDRVNEEFLSQYGYTSDQIIGHNENDFASVEDCYNVHENNNLGQFIADAYRWKISSTDTGNDDEVAAACAPAGTIRATFPRGDVTISKVYEVFSLGQGLEGSVGYPLVDIYLTGEELMTVCEVDASVSPFMTSAVLHLSGLEYEFNPNRALLNKTTDVWLEGDIGADDREPVNPDKLYRIVTDLYSMRMLGAVENVSMGVISLTPKLKDGTPITDESECVIHDAQGNEVKAWIAIADYIRSFDDDGDGIGEIPSLYDGSDIRKVSVDSKAPADNIKGANKYFWGFIIIVVLLIAIISVIIILIVRMIRKIMGHRATAEIKKE